MIMMMEMAEAMDGVGEAIAAATAEVAAYGATSQAFLAAMTRKKTHMQQ
jgi:hypothetical protein